QDLSIGAAGWSALAPHIPSQEWAVRPREMFLGQKSQTTSRSQSAFRENTPPMRNSVRKISRLNGKSTVAIVIWRMALLMIGPLYLCMLASKAPIVSIARGDSHPLAKWLAKTCASLNAVFAPCAPNGGMV